MAEGLARKWFPPNSVTHVVLGQLDLNGLGVRVDGPLGVQGGVCVVDPGLQL